MTVYLTALVHMLTGRVTKSERGATAVEYGIMVALIAVVVIGAVTAIGTNLNTMFNTVSTKV